MDLGLKGKVAIVTGAGQGIGREIVKTLAREGAKVVVSDLYLERATAVAEEIKGAGGEALPIGADVTNSEQVNAMVEKTVEEFGKVDILVNNAGVPVERRTSGVGRGYFKDMTKRDWDVQINLNLYGNFNCTHAVLPHLINQQCGKIVSIISDAGRVGEPLASTYSAAKAGIVGFSKALAQEVGRYRINVNCVSPGATQHEAAIIEPPEEATAEQQERFRKVLRRYPIAQGLGRLGRPTDIANAVAFLASEAADFITGQVLSVSGGYSMVS